MTPQQIEDRAWADFSTIPDGLNQLKRMAADADPQSQEYRDILDVTRTLLRLQPLPPA